MAFGQQNATAGIVNVSEPKRLKQPSQRVLNLIQELNEAQQKAVCLPSESALILAGAGSGKTKVLTSRIAYMIDTNMAQSFNILAVTFTNKAAKEMLERLEKVGVHTTGMWVGTFHGICHRVLRRFYNEAGLHSGFQILDVDDSKAVVKRIFKDKGWEIDDKEKTDGMFTPKSAYEKIASWKEEGLYPENMPDPSYRKNDKDYGKFLKAFFAYQQYLKDENAVDFADLLNLVVKIMDKHAHVLNWAQNQFKMILVDEFQDTNNIQYRLIRMISSDGENPVFAVGDDDQSIYGFRGAVVENVRSFAKDFRVSSDALVKLEQNYRSVGVVLKAANALIDHNKNRMGKNLWTSQDDGPLIEVHELADGRSESELFVQHVKKLRNQGINLNQIACLYRTNSQSRELEEGLRVAGIPYIIYGGLRFYERAEIKTALAYLRAAVNEFDVTSWLRVINTPLRGIGPKSIEKFKRESIEQGLSFGGYLQQYNYTGERFDSTLKELVELMTDVKKRVDSLESMVPIMESIYQKAGLIAFYRAEKDGNDRVDNLKELLNDLYQFELRYEGEPEEKVSAFLAQAQLEPGEKKSQKHTEEMVQLMSVHASKGLEFEHVLIAGVEDNLFPHSRVLRSENMEKELEEERRLMYVAITRAKKSLIMTRAKMRMTYGSTSNNPESLFIRELPKELIKRFDLEKEELIFESRKSSINRAEINSLLSRGAKSSGLGQTRVKSIFSNYEYEDGLNVGVRVQHAKLGVGTILTRQGSSSDETVDVLFSDGSKRRLVIKMANLMILE